ncbi:MAG: tagaturonate reductase [Ginsengibacter sp.]
MKLSRLNLRNLNTDNISLPDGKTFDLPEKVLQFGTGVLLRGLPDFFIDAANKAGIFNGRIVVVKSTKKGDTEAFDRQDGLYTLGERGIQNGKKVERNILCSAISRVLDASSEWMEILKCAHNEKMQIIISNTTEVGIQLVKEDIHQCPPVSYPGKLLAFLYERFKAFKGREDTGLVIIPTELLPENGALLQSIVLELAHLNHLEDGFIEWLENSNTFCNSLVDRIVIGMPPQELRNKIESELGYKDDLLIVSEVYRLWAIEGDEKIKKILSFAGADEGIKIEPSIDLYRELKLRLLNGTHTLCCGLAFYSGFDVVYQAMNDEIFSSFLERLMREEIAPAVPYQIDDAVKQNYISHVVDRFRNPHIQHRWINITLNYTSKMKTRCIPLLVEHYNKSSTVPHLFALGFAAYLWFMKPFRQEGKEFFGKKNDEEYLIEDPLAEKLSAHWQKDNIETVVNGVLSDISLWEQDLTQFEGFSAAVTNNLNSIKSEGMKNTLNIIQKNR